MFPSHIKMNTVFSMEGVAFLKCTVFLWISFYWHLLLSENLRFKDIHKFSLQLREKKDQNNLMLSQAVEQWLEKQKMKLSQQANDGCHTSEGCFRRAVSATAPNHMAHIKLGRTSARAFNSGWNSVISSLAPGKIAICQTEPRWK